MAQDKICLDLPPMRPMLIDASYAPYLREQIAARTISIDQEDVSSRRERMATNRSVEATGVPADVLRSVTSVVTGTHTIPVRVYRPRDLDDRLPVILYIHGGGWMYGSAEQSEATAIGYCREVGAVVVSPDYRLAPESPFPGAFEDCFSVLRWIFDGAAQSDVDEQRVAVAGESSGGNLAAACALGARQTNYPRLCLQVLNYPALGNNYSTRSYLDNEHAPILSSREMVYFWKNYVAQDKYTNDPRAVPLCEPDLTGVAPVYMVTAEYDPLRDDGFEYVKRLAHCGVSVTHEHAQNLTHGFMRAWSLSKGVQNYANGNCSALRNAFSIESEKVQSSDHERKRDS